MASILMVKRIIAFGAMVLLLCQCSTKQQAIKEEDTEVEPADNKVQLIRNEVEKKVDVLIDGKLFTAYRYPDNIMKPVLYPLVTPEGTSITRKYPLEKSVGERVDHPHHVGVWLNYGDVNGLDFWNNSEAIKEEDKPNFGTILHKEIRNLEEKGDHAILETTMDWRTPDGTVLLVEETKFVFGVEEGHYYIDRLTKLTAQEQEVTFNDNKEGMIGIRVARALEHPSDKAEVFTDANGVPTKVAKLDNEGVNGLYVNSQGVTGVDCWGIRSEWVNLTSKIGDEDISLVILDHPENVGYPTYWHARSYGLFAANPLGQKVFSEGKEELNFKLAPGESTVFKYRIIVASENLDKATLDKEFKDFTEVKM